MLDFDCDMLLHLDGIQDDRLGYCSGFISQFGKYRNISTGCIEMEVLDPKVFLSFFKCGAGCEWCLAPPGIQCSGKHVLGLGIPAQFAYVPSAGLSFFSQSCICS